MQSVNARQFAVMVTQNYVISDLSSTIKKLLHVENMKLMTEKMLFILVEMKSQTFMKNLSNDDLWMSSRYVYIGENIHH
jgi:hypothetical protein